MQKLNNLTGVFGSNFLYFDELNSTNTYLKENGAQLPHGTAVIAKHQTAGKGRQGKLWDDDDSDSALKMSFLIKDITAQQLTIIPLICGLAAAYTVEKLSGCGCMIKWPNDVIMNNKKIAGILCESRISDDGIYAVCGIGINIAQTQQYFEKQNLLFATSVLTESGVKLSKNDTASNILNYFDGLYNNYCKNGFNDIREAYKNRCINIGRQVKVVYQNKTLQGTAVDINSSGGLVCSIDGELINIIANEASVRGLYGYV